MLQKMPKALSDWRAAWLADQDGRFARGGQRIDKQADLGAFAAPFRTFEADEETCLTHEGHDGDHES